MNLAAGQVMTVTGPVEPGALGFTLAHEHLYIQMWDIPGRFDYAQLLDDDEVLAEELKQFKARGGGSLVELTLPDMGRQPDRLRALSLRCGVHIVMGCGWYREPYYRAVDAIERRSVAALADQLVAEITDGIGPDRIRPGVIGEIGVEKGWVSPAEERVHRAAARAHRATGLPLVTHSPLSAVGLDQLALFEEEGVDPSRVVIGHCDSYPHLEYFLEIMRRGAYVALDNIGTGHPGRHEARLAVLVARMVEQGFESRILLSHDIFRDPQLTYHGGPGYIYLADRFLPMLRECGLDDATIDRVTKQNPAEWLTIQPT